MSYQPTNEIPHGMVPVRRGVKARTLDYMLAYSAGPAKLGAISSADLAAARERWTHLSTYTQLASIEKAMQTRIDEEGCGAFFAAVTWA